MNSRPVECGATSSRFLSITTTAGFLVLIYALPLVQLVSELLGINANWPTAFGLLPRVLQSFGNADSQPTFVSGVMAVNDRLCREFQAYEKQVTESAWIVAKPREWLQATLSGPLRTGNEQVIIGRNGTLYFRPDFEALTGPDFLHPRPTRPGGVASRRQADPLPAIRRFAADLEGRGIRLLLVPVPSKAGLLARQTTASSRHNVAFPSFLAELNHGHIAHCDLSGLLFGDQTLPVQGPAYLTTDSHWTPRAMQESARAIVDQLQSTGIRPDPAKPRFVARLQTVDKVGDTAQLLAKDATRLVNAERVEITQVLNVDQLLWTPDPRGDILLLGDSFSNIYSDPDLGWGTSAGLAEHLSLILNRPLDRISLNAGGALATRKELIRQLQQNPSRLRGTQVVIWQFAERELSFGDWQVLPLPVSEPGADAQVVMASAPDIVEGILTEAGHLPDPASLPYREALLSLRIKTTPSPNQHVPPEFVVYVWGLQDRRPTPAASWQPGQRVRLKLTPWSAAELKFGRYARAELDDPNLTAIDLPTYWGEAP